MMRDSRGSAGRDIIQRRIEQAHKIVGTLPLLAARIGVPLRTLEDWKRGARRPRGLAARALLERLAEICGHTTPSAVSRRDRPAP